MNQYRANTTVSVQVPHIPFNTTLITPVTAVNPVVEIFGVKGQDYECL